MAQCLLVISEDNPIAWCVLNNSAQELVSLVVNVDENEQNIVLRTVAAAVLSNVPSLSTIYIKPIFDALNQALTINHRVLLGKLTSSIPLNGNGNRNSIEVEVTADEIGEETDEEATMRRRKQDLPSEYDVQVKNVCWMLEAQRIAAETITNLCSSDDDSE